MKLVHLLLLGILTLQSADLAWARDEGEMVDVVIYGATPAGIASAIAAAKGDRSVLLVEPTRRIGGLTASGLSHPDFHAFEALTGTYRELTQRCLAYYKETYGGDSQQVRDCFRGTHAEPKVNLMIFEQMLAEHPNIEVKTEWVLVDAFTRGPSGERWISSARFADGQGRKHLVNGKVFIDASYEGDLLAAAHIEYRVGVESRDEYGESAAPEESSGDLQGYNFRLTMTQDPDLRVLPKQPKGYDRELFVGLLDLIAEEKIKQAFGTWGDRDNVFKAQIPILPNGKRDINDVSRGWVRLSLPGEQLMWPEGNAATRQEIYDEHVLWNVGLIYFLQNDPEVPDWIQQEALSWGFCRDEFEATDHIPPQLYVREARRMVGMRIYTQHDTRHEEGDARAVLHRDAIAMGEYGHSSHGVRHEGSRFGGQRFGEGLGVSFAPYQVPYGTLVPKDVRNLLSPVAVSASHVGFCALRLEPIWTSLGQAAGHAAHLALTEQVPDVRTVPVPELQRLLHADGSATIYVSDVLPGDPDFAAVQWWGSVGGLHGLQPRPEGSGRGRTIEGQHTETWLNHDVGMDRPLNAELAARWRVIAADLGLSAGELPQAGPGTTRGDWIWAAYELARK